MAADPFGDPGASTEVLPMMADASPAFDSTMRGYDRDQVDGYVDRLDAELRAMTAEREASAARSADLAAQLASTAAQVESLRRQLRVATERVTEDNVDERVAQQLDAARAQAGRIVGDAEEHAESVRTAAGEAARHTKEAAEADAARIVADAEERKRQTDDLFRAKMVEIDQHKASVEARLAAASERTRVEQEQHSAAAHNERARLEAASAAERTGLETASAAEITRLETESAELRARLEAESDAARRTADDDFEITLRLRRTEAYAEIDERQATSRTEAARAIADAHAEGVRLIEAAQAEVRRLAGIRERSHANLRSLHADLGARLEAAASGAPDDTLAPAEDALTDPAAVPTPADPEAPTT